MTMNSTIPPEVEHEEIHASVQGSKEQCGLQTTPQPHVKVG